MKYFKSLLLLIVVAIITTSCHKDPPKTYDDTDMTVTYYNTDFNFSSYNNFIVPDSTQLTTNYLTENEVDAFYAEGGVSDQTLDLITQSFLDIGYTQVDSLDDADFIAIPTIMMTESDETVWYGTGWWWYYPGYGYGWGYGYKSTNYYYYPIYPWYPSGYQVTISTFTGSVAFEILDAESYRQVIEWNETHPDPPEPGDEVPEMKINWQALIQGYTTDDGQYNKDRAERGIDEAFEQSPYLKK